MKVTRRPPASSAEARARMRAMRQRDTEPELDLRRAMHAIGLRYNINRSLLLGSRRVVDVVFPRAKVAVLVDGCFWHSCPSHQTIPKANQEWWIAKLQANWNRDRDTDQRLKRHGWTVVRVWEHEKAPAAAARIARIVRRRLSRLE